jgi:Winged helix-turn helix
MPARLAAALALRAGDGERLSSWGRSSSLPAGVVQRARIVLLRSRRGVEHRDRLAAGVSRPTVIGWRDRYVRSGVNGLADKPRSGRPRARIITETLRPPPKALGVTHWSSRLLARRLKVGNATVARAWRDYGVQPWRVETFKFSTDPQLVGKVTDMVGLYLAPP